MFCKLMSKQCQQISKYRTNAAIVSLNQVRMYGNIKAKNDDTELQIGLNLFENASTRKSTKHLQVPSIKDMKMSPVAKSVQKQKLRIIDDTELGLQFIRLDLQNPLLRTLMTRVKSRKQHEKNREIVVEGRRLIHDALKCGLHMRALLFSQTDQLRLIKNEVANAQRKNSQTQLYKVPQHDLKTWSCLTTPSGLLAIFDRPIEGVNNLQMSAMPITVICDNIREPNNLGSIIRTCSAIPCSQVIVTRGCCDPWESKALRGGCGGQFRIPILDDVIWENLHSLLPSEVISDCRIFIAENNLGTVENSTIQTINYTNLDKSNIGTHNVVIIGGESHGVSQNAYRFLETAGAEGKCLYIPVADGVDSLNVVSALTLILYELRRHLETK